MRIFVSHPRSWSPAAARWANRLIGAGVIGCALFLLVALRLEWISLLPATSAPSAGPAPAAEKAKSSVVRLPPEKLQAADLHLATAVIAPIQQTRAVPGTITYNAGRRLTVTAPVDSVVVRVLAEPGQHVAAQDPLAVLSSSAVGLARDEVLKRRADLELARQELTFAEGVAGNVEQLLSQLQQKPKLEDLEQSLAGKLLGEHREKIVAAYSKLVLAELTASETASLGESGALSKRLVEERRSAREVAAAQFAAACETSKFTAMQARNRARAEAEQAERLVAVAEEAAARLVGPQADATPVTAGAQLSELVLRAPLAGRIEERQAVEAARVAAGSPLFVVADTSVMWVSAEIHERDWPALKELEGAAARAIDVQIPALGADTLEARVRFVGASVDPTTRSVPLVAEIANASGQLKPGMFVWVQVPLESPRESLVVPIKAIMWHEQQPFVFVPAGAGAFRRADVQLGIQTRTVAEILGGLAAGEQVVDRGAFYLKSELLLESEE